MVVDELDVICCIGWLRRSFRLSCVPMAEMLIPLHVTEEELRPVLARMRDEGKLTLDKTRGWAVVGKRA